MIKKSRKTAFLPAVSNLIKLLNLRTNAMTKRKTYKFQKGSIIEVEEYHDGAYGAPGKSRQKKEKPTSEQMRRINALNKTRLARHRLLEYFTPGDIFATLTYAVENRPPDMKRAKADFTAFRVRISRAYKKKGATLRWMRNIEQGTKGAWHIHIVIKDCEGAASIIQDAWPHGGVYIERIGRSKFHDKDMSQLAAYITKDEHTTEKKKDGTRARPRIQQALYSASRNMPLRKPKIERMVRWKKEPKPPKGYYIAKCHEGTNPITGHRYRRYTMYRIRDEEQPPGK